MWKLGRVLTRFRFKHAPGLVDRMVRLSTMRAVAMLRKEGPIGVLVDNTILDHAVIHETARISTGREVWGNSDIETGYSARINVHSPESKTREHVNLQYIPGLVALSERGLVDLFASGTLWTERFYQPAGTTGPKYIYDYSLLGRTKLKCIDRLPPLVMGPRWFNLPPIEDQLREWLSKKEREDTLYASLVDVLGRKHSQDAWHIRTAEKHALFCFLTMERHIFRVLDAQKNNPRIKSLETKILTPEQLGKHLGLMPIKPVLFSHHNASYPVRADISWPDGKRRGRMRRKKKSK